MQGTEQGQSKQSSTKAVCDDPVGEKSSEEFKLSFMESNFKSSDDFKSSFRIKQTIGVGGQAHVKEALDTKSKEKVALKIFKKRKLNFFGLNSAHFEYSIVKELDHPNILSSKGFYEDSDYLCIVSELMSSDLRALLVELEAPMTETQIKYIFRQMLLALRFCHQNHIVHRDIKLENFLVDLDQDQNILVKLSDFGLACKFDKEDPPTTKCGSILSVAPEMLVKESYCPKVDMWGLGVILHELLSTELPFYSDNETEYKRNIVKQKLQLQNESAWQKVSEQAKDLVEKLLDKNPERRLDAKDALNHPWFDEIGPKYNNRPSNELMVLSSEAIDGERSLSNF